MECDACSKDFDRAERIPKITPCRHTVCLDCLWKGGLAGRRVCPMCLVTYNVFPAALPNHESLLRLIERQGEARVPRGWCTDCRAAATSQCWDEHAVLNTKAALRRHMPDGTLQQAAQQLEGLQRQCQEEQVLLTLLTAESWDLTLRDGARVLTGTLRNADDPVVKAAWLVLAERAGLGEEQDAAQNPGDAGPAAARAWRVVRKIDCLLRDNNSATRDAALLQDAAGVVELVRLNCSAQAWSLEMLRRAAPTVQHLGLYFPQEDHFVVVATMPRLRRLDLLCYSSRQMKVNLPGPGQAGLQWLKIRNIPPRSLLISLLKAHGPSLQELELTVSSHGNQQSAWPCWPECPDLDLLLGQCNLPALRRLRLCRPDAGYHNVAGCEQQCESLRWALPATEVLCDAQECQ